MKRNQITNALIASSLFILAVIIALGLSSTFQDPTFIIYSLFGKIAGTIGLLYLLSAFVIRMKKPLLSKYLLIVGAILLVAGVAFAVGFATKPIQEEIPSTLSYYKFVHIEEVYQTEDSTVIAGYRYVDTPFTGAELDTLSLILKEEHKTFIIGKNGEILVSKGSPFNAEEMNRIYGLLLRRMDK